MSVQQPRRLDPAADSTGERRVLTDALAAAAQECGDRTLIQWVDDGSPTTYAEMYHQVVRRSRVLAELGVRRGDRVGIFSSDGREFLTTTFAAMHLGAVATPIGVELRGASLRHPLRLYSPLLVVVDDDLRPIMRTAVENLEIRPKIVVTDELAAASGGDDSSESPLETPTPSRLADPCLIMSTSGTTGPSKGSLWDYGTIETWAMTYVRNLHYTPEDRIYCCTPLTHANALVTGVMVAIYGMCSVAIAPRFSVRRFWSDIRHTESTTANLLGSMIHLLLRADDAEAGRASSLRTMLVSSCSATSYRQVQRKWDLTPVCAYGLTDFGTLTIATDTHGCPPGSCGREVEDFELRLVDEHYREIRQGEIGELLARPRRPWAAPSGYFGMPEESLRSRRNLWFHTGDLLRQDENGWFYFAGRTKDALRYRGENVSAHEVEQVLTSRPEIEEAAVYAVASPLGEDEIVAALVAEEPESLDLAALTRAISAELPHYSVPRYFRVVSALPKNGSQRVVKQPLSAHGIDDQTWDREAAGVVVTRNKARPTVR